MSVARFPRFFDKKIAVFSVRFVAVKEVLFLKVQNIFHLVPFPISQIHYRPFNKASNLFPFQWNSFFPMLLTVENGYFSVLKCLGDATLVRERESF